MSPRRITALLLILGVTAGATWLWHEHSRANTLQRSVPPQPALANFPTDLTRRIKIAEHAIRSGTNRTAALADLAQLYHANGFTAEAVVCYRGLLQLEPQNPRWPHRLACIYAGLGQLEDALVLWQRALRLDPNYVPGRIRVGDALLKLNRNSEAGEAYRAALTRDTTHPHALVGLARLDMAAQRWREARDRLEQAAAKSQGRIGADLLATVYEQLGDAERALALRGRIKSSGAFYDLADPWLDEIMDDCFDVYRLTVAAGFADHSGDAVTAQRLIERALQLAPENAPTLYQNGTFALHRRDYAKARSAFEACTRVAPNFSDGWAQLVNVHHILGNEAAAESALVAGLQHCPDSGGLNFERANRLMAVARYPEAVAALEKTLRASPTDADARVKLAQVYFKLERVDDGVAALKRALLAEPEHPAALTTLALHAIGSHDETAAREWMRRIRQQPRIPREMTEALTSEFRKQFGTTP
jgi:tetratricopeptide (TPR) repeat protein